MLYDNVAALCEERSITIARLERDTGLGNGTIGKWRKSSPTVDRVKLVADYFGITVDSLLTVHKTAQR